MLCVLLYVFQVSGDKMMGGDAARCLVTARELMLMCCCDLLLQVTCDSTMGWNTVIAVW
jgi:hypothetical protein